MKNKTKKKVHTNNVAFSAVTFADNSPFKM